MTLFIIFLIISVFAFKLITDEWPISATPHIDFFPDYPAGYLFWLFVIGSYLLSSFFNIGNV